MIGVRFGSVYEVNLIRKPGTKPFAFPPGSQAPPGVADAFEKGMVLQTMMFDKIRQGTVGDWFFLSPDMTHHDKSYVLTNDSEGDHAKQIRDIYEGLRDQLGSTGKYSGKIHLYHQDQKDAATEFINQCTTIKKVDVEYEMLDNNSMDKAARYEQGKLP